MEKVAAFFGILGAIAAIVAAFIAVQQGCWHSVPNEIPTSLPVYVDPKPLAPEPSAPAVRGTPEPYPHQVLGPETAVGAGVALDSATDRQEFRPLEFSLSNGEQTVLLAGQATVGVEFNSVGEENLVTVRTHSPGREPETRAVLGTNPSDRFDLTAGGKEYSVVILRVDYEAGRVKFQLDRKE